MNNDSSSNSHYIGNELHIFKEAVNWKHYWINSVKKYIVGDVLEVGAGIGVNTSLIIEKCPNINSLTAIEPDKNLADAILNNVRVRHDIVSIKPCYLHELGKIKKFDTILYIDVIEHIEDDCSELELAKTFLKDNGHIIILVPAYNSLYSPFDKAIGHYRRYNKKRLLYAAPKELVKVKMFYLDVFGAMASLVNKLILKQKYPSKRQILKWDKLIVPSSKLMDKVLLHSAGKSLIGIWKK